MHSRVDVDRADRVWAEKTLKNLSLEEKVGQLFMIRMRVELLKWKESQLLRSIRNNIRKYHIGALAMSAPPQGQAQAIFAVAMRSLRCSTSLQEESKLPLLVAGDFERGVLPAHLFGTTVFPHAMAFGASAGNLAYAEEFGRITAQESRASWRALESVSRRRRKFQHG